MCQLCDEDQPHPAARLSRRNFLAMAGGVATGIALARPAVAKAPPKPENVTTPAAALERLEAGNRRYVEGVMRRHDFKAEREALAKGQNPYAAILSCADSRVAPEFAFDSGRGDLFVVRVAGNFATDDGIASAPPSRLNQQAHHPGDDLERPMNRGPCAGVTTGSQADTMRTNERRSHREDIG